MGLLSIVLCLKFIPNEKIGLQSSKDEKLVDDEAGQEHEKGVFGKYNSFIVAMFLLMFTFFVYPAEFAIETSKEGLIPQQFIAVIMAGMDLIAFIGGLSFVHIKKYAGNATKFISPVLFALGYLLLWLMGGWVGTIVGSALIGFANGLGVPFIISSASQQAGKSAAVTIMPMLSMALYLGQFATPLILSVFTGLLEGASINHMPYMIAFCSALLFGAWSIRIKTAGAAKHQVRQE